MKPEHACRGLILAIVATLAVAPVSVYAETADEFVAQLNKDFADIGLELNAAESIKH